MSTSDQPETQPTERRRAAHCYLVAAGIFTMAAASFTMMGGVGAEHFHLTTAGDTIRKLVVGMFTVGVTLFLVGEHLNPYKEKEDESDGTTGDLVATDQAALQFADKESQG